MLSSIRKFSKTFTAKIFVAIIALPFIFWGMGPLFVSGKKNVLLEINDNKTNAEEFIAYIRKINLNKDEVKRIGKSKIFDQILTNYIGDKIIGIETEKKGIQLTDRALKNILINDKDFLKDGKFSRTRYEKFLLKNRYAAPIYERSIANIELKGQLLAYYGGGIKLPKFIINDSYKRENQIKEIDFIDLNKIYSKNTPSEEDIKSFYEKNKSLFKEKFKTFKYLELTPEILTEKKDFDEDYFKKLDGIENDILDGKTFDSIVSRNKQKVINIEFVNSRKSNQDGVLLEKINDTLLKKIFSIENKNKPEFINFDNNYYVAEVLDEKDMVLTLKDQELKKTIIAQLKINFIIKENAKLLEKIRNKKFHEKEMLQLSKKNNVTINKAKINNIKDTSKFSPNLLKTIYKFNSGQIFVLSDDLLKKNYLVRITKEKDPKIDPNSDIYKQYVAKANAEYISKVYKSYDNYINANYKIDVNNRVLERLKNSF